MWQSVRHARLDILASTRACLIVWNVRPERSEEKLPRRRIIQRFARRAHQVDSGVRTAVTCWNACGARRGGTSRTSGSLYACGAYPDAFRVATPAPLVRHAPSATRKTSGDPRSAINVKLAKQHSTKAPRSARGAQRAGSDPRVLFARSDFSGREAIRTWKDANLARLGCIRRRKVKRCVFRALLDFIRTKRTVPRV